MFFVDSAVARRLESASAARGAEYARAQGRLHPEFNCAVDLIAGGYAIYAGPGSPVNRAVGLGMHEPVRRADLSLIREFFRDRSEAPAVQLCPLAHPSLLTLLGEAGFHVDHFFSVLVMPVAAATVSEPESGLRITQAAPDQAEMWIRTVAEGFRGEEPPTEWDYTVLGANFHSAIATCYFAWVDDQPAGGGATITHEGVAELCSASTRLPYRRRGVQAALVHARLAVCRAAGIDLAMVFTSPGSNSQRNVERLGFRVAYSDAVVAET
jgi:GNAT superfamily N-acetyltransferase